MFTDETTRRRATGREWQLAPAPQIEEILRAHRHRRAGNGERTRFDRVAFVLWATMVIAVAVVLAAVAASVVLDAAGVAF